MSVLTNAERFWMYAGDADLCWEWQGTRLSEPNLPYGYFWLNGTKVRAHRYAYEMAVGPISDGLLVCHRCDNPPCVRPTHLFLGTQSENIRDSVAKGRFQVPRPTLLHRGELNGNAKLTDAQVTEIRSRYTGVRGEKTALAVEYGISKTHLGRLLRGSDGAPRNRLDS